MADKEEKILDPHDALEDFANTDTEMPDIEAEMNIVHVADVASQNN